MNDDSINRQAAIDALNTVYNEWQTQESCSALEEATSMIEGLPSAERKGKWINHRNDDGHNIADCSECGSAIQWFDDDEKPRYCCMCGSRNKEEEKE